MNESFRVGITRTLMKPDGSYDLPGYGLDGLEGATGIDWAFLDEATAEITPEQARDFDALLVEFTGVPAASVGEAGRLTIVARYGVGYDSVDIEACTRAGVIVTNAPDGSRRPMATANLAFLLSLSLRMLTKDRMTREGRWDEWASHLGIGLIGKTLGIIGLGSIGRETLRLAGSLDMRHLVYDPFVTADAVRVAGARSVSLDSLLRESDFVCVCVPLTAQTRGLIGADQLRLMKPTAFLINTARGAIVDQRALTAALTDRRIQGAGLDVFEKEPMDADDPLLRLDNVILSPHALGCTDECFVLTGRSAVESILEVAHGRIPQFVVNRPVLDHPGLQAKLRAFASR